MQQEKTPKVSVCVITYNHEKYIRQCLQSIVDQEVDFDFEVIVGADCSPDNTQAIVREFAERYPELIAATFHDKNIGGTNNYRVTHAKARGEFVAHIDGDDLMLPGKIRTQARYLNENPDFVAVWHRVRTITGDSHVSEPMPATEIEPVSQRSVLQRGFAAHHSSLMYRREKGPALRSSGEILDLHISVELLKNGRGAILPDILGVYRRGVGVTANDKEGFLTLVKESLDYYLRVYPQYRCEINRCAFSLFVREAATGGRQSAGFFHTFLISLNVKTPISVGGEGVLLAQKAIAKLLSLIVNR